MALGVHVALLSGESIFLEANQEDTVNDLRPGAVAFLHLESHAWKLQRC